MLLRLASSKIFTYLIMLSSDSYCSDLLEFFKVWLIYYWTICLLRPFDQILAFTNKMVEIGLQIISIRSVNTDVFVHLVPLRSRKVGLTTNLRLYARPLMFYRGEYSSVWRWLLSWNGCGRKWFGSYSLLDPSLPRWWTLCSWFP